MSYISDEITRDQFLESVYDKSKSESSRELARTAINQFDTFCMNVYGKDSVDVVLQDLKKDALETGSTDKVLIFLNSFIQWLGKDHPDLQVGTGHKNSSFRPMRARMPSSIGHISFKSEIMLKMSEELKNRS